MVGLTDDHTCYIAWFIENNTNCELAEKIKKILFLNVNRLICVLPSTMLSAV